MPVAESGGCGSIGNTVKAASRLPIFLLYATLMKNPMGRVVLRISAVQSRESLLLFYSFQVIVSECAGA